MSPIQAPHEPDQHPLMQKEIAHMHLLQMQVEIQSAALVKTYNKLVEEASLGTPLDACYKMRYSC